VRRTTGAAGTTCTLGTTGAAATIARTALAALPVRFTRTAATPTLAHLFAHLSAFFVAQFAVAIFVEVLEHALLHRSAGCLAFFVAELAVAVFIVLFEHPFAHLFATRPVAFAAAVFGRLCQRGQRHQASSCEQ
jgi:hypothetical protein